MGLIHLCLELMVPWEPADTPWERNDYFDLTPLPPSEVLGSFIKDYRELKYLATPRGVDFNPEFYRESGGVPPQDWSKREQKIWKSSYNIWQATQELRKLFLECGWNTETSNQSAFRRDEFMEKRDRYWADVVGPLLDIEKRVADPLNADDSQEGQ